MRDDNKTMADWVEDESLTRDETLARFNALEPVTVVSGTQPPWTVTFGHKTTAQGIQVPVAYEKHSTTAGQYASAS